MRLGSRKRAKTLCNTRVESQRFVLQTMHTFLRGKFPSEPLERVQVQKDRKIWNQGIRRDAVQDSEVSQPETSPSTLVSERGIGVTVAKHDHTSIKRRPNGSSDQIRAGGLKQ